MRTVRHVRVTRERESNHPIHGGALHGGTHDLPRTPPPRYVGELYDRGLRVLLNILWLVLAGIWMAFAYTIAGVVMCITIIGIPFGVQAFKLAGYALWPFGRVLAPTGRHQALSVIGNIVWLVLAGWWLALGHLFTGMLLCITIVGIPLGVASFKLAGASLVPFGKEITDIRSLQQIPPGAIVVGPSPAQESP